MREEERRIRVCPKTSYCGECRQGSRPGQRVCRLRVRPRAWADSANWREGRAFRTCFRAADDVGARASVPAPCGVRIVRALRCGRQSARRCRSRGCLHRRKPMRWTFRATAERATARAKPPDPCVRTRPRPRSSRFLIADSTAGCWRRIAPNPSARSRSRSALLRQPFFGSPVSHSRSPSVQNAAMDALGLDFAHLAFDTTDAAAAVAEPRSLGRRGGNSIIPLKQAVIPHPDALSAEAELAGAVNVIVYDGGRLTGHATDGGFRSWHHEGFPLHPSKVPGCSSGDCRLHLD